MAEFTFDQFGGSTATDEVVRRAEEDAETKKPKNGVFTFEEFGEREFAAPAKPLGPDDLPKPANAPQNRLRRPGFALGLGLQQNPDQAAENRRLSQESGLGLTVVEGNRDALIQQKKLADTQRLTNDRPATATLLSDPYRASVAHDSVEQLAAAEGLFQVSWNALARGLLRIEGGIAQSSAERRAQRADDATKSFGEMVGEHSPLEYALPGPEALADAGWRFIASRMSGLLGQDDVTRAAELQQEAGLIQQRIAETPKSAMAQRLQEDVIAGVEAGGLLGGLRAAASSPLSALVFGMETAAEFTPQLVAAAMATAATRNPQSGAAMLGLGSFATERFSSPTAWLTERGYDLTKFDDALAVISNPDLMAEAAQYGFTRGAVIGSFDALSAGLAGKVFGNALTNLVAQAAMQTTGGAGGEAMAQVATEGKVTDWAGVIFEALGELATTPFDITMIGGQSLLSVRNRDKTKVERNKNQREVLDDVRSQVMEAPVTERAPEVAAAHVAQSLANEGVHTVYVSVEALDNFARESGVEPDALLQSLGVTSEQAEDARLLGSDVTISGEAFAENILLGEEATYNALADHLRFEADGLTTAEAAQLPSVEEELASLDEPAPADAEAAVTQELPALRADTEQNKLGPVTLVPLAEINAALSSQNLELMGGQAVEDQAFIATLAETLKNEGILQPLAATRNADGTITVQDGLHRIAAARLAGIDALPVQFENEAEVGSRDPNDQTTDPDNSDFDQMSLEMQTLEGEKSTSGPWPGWRPESKPEAEVDAPVTLAETELGLRALFRSALDAGMNSKTYARYLAAVQRASEAGRKRMERRMLRQQLRESTATWKTELGKVSEEVRNRLVNEDPFYRAVDVIAKGESPRLDRNEALEVLGNPAQLALLPKLPDKRTIYAPADAKKKGEETVSPELYAEHNGFISAGEMLFGLTELKPLAQAVEEQAQQIMLDRHGDLRDAMRALEAAIEELHDDTHAEVLALELNQLREATNQGRLKPKVVRAAVRQLLLRRTLTAIDVRKFLADERKWSREAGKRLRKGDRRGASQAKLYQLMNFEMAREANAIRDRIAKQQKFLVKFTRKPKKNSKLPLTFFETIRDMLADYNFGPRMTPQTREKWLAKWVAQQVAQGVALPVPQAVLDADRQVPWREMTLAEWEDLHAAARMIYKEGLELDAMTRATEKATRQEIVAPIIGAVQARARENPNLGRETNLEALGRWGRFYWNTAVKSMDTLLVQLDGGEALGHAYNNVKGRYDRAMNGGYRDGQTGYMPRIRRASQELFKIIDAHFPENVRRDFNERFRIPGVHQNLTHNVVVSVLLNSGNQHNLDALTDSGQLTLAEVKAIHAYASKADWDFAQAVWDYLDTYWPEINETIIRRTNVPGERVEAQEIVTPHGTYRGGYYALKWDATADGSTNISVEEAIQSVRRGEPTMSHTRRGFTEARKENSGRRNVLLDVFALQTHIQQVIYDLEVGDAVTDMYRIWHHNALKSAFKDAGLLSMWEAGDLWLGDITTGEIRRAGFAESFLRWTRAGFTVSKIGFRVSTTVLQPLGLLQTAAETGPKAIARGLLQVATSPQTGPNSVYSFVQSQTPAMAERSTSYNKDILDFIEALQNGWLARNTSERFAYLVGESFFYGIKKAQQLVDTVVWLGTKEQGMAMFDGDVERANAYADRMVTRTQASSIFGERTSFERGTASPNMRQTEAFRIWTGLISYFVAKNNVALRITGRTDFRKPMEAVDWAARMMTLYAGEALVMFAIESMFQDDDDDDDEALKALGWNVASSVLNGVPWVRELSSTARGFSGGGIQASITGTVGKFVQQVGQGELDTTLMKSGMDVVGVFGKLPSSQVSLTLEAMVKASQGEDVDWWEYAYGVDR